MSIQESGRRNLADIDWISIAVAREVIIARQAKENQIRKPESVSVKSQEQKPIDTRKESAKAAGVGEQKYSEGKTIPEAVASGEVEPEPLCKSDRA